MDAAGPALPFPARRRGECRQASLVALDWNHDFKMDLVAAGPGGVRLFIQSADGTFTDETVARVSARAARLQSTRPAPGQPTSRWTATSTSSWAFARRRRWC